jgi:hypothetical protein
MLSESALIDINSDHVFARTVAERTKSVDRFQITSMVVKTTSTSYLFAKLHPRQNDRQRLSAQPWLHRQ